MDQDEFIDKFVRDLAVKTGLNDSTVYELLLKGWAYVERIDTAPCWTKTTTL